MKKIEFQFPFLFSSCMQHSINSIGNNNNNGTKQTNCLPMAYARFAAFYLHFTYIVAVCYAIPHMSCTKWDWIGCGVCVSIFEWNFTFLQSFVAFHQFKKTHLLIRQTAPQNTRKMAYNELNTFIHWMWLDHKNVVDTFEWYQYENDIMKMALYRLARSFSTSILSSFFVVLYPSASILCVFPAELQATYMYIISCKIK